MFNIWKLNELNNKELNTLEGTFWVPGNFLRKMSQGWNCWVEGYTLRSACTFSAWSLLLKTCNFCNYYFMLVGTRHVITLWLISVTILTDADLWAWKVAFRKQGITWYLARLGYPSDIFQSQLAHVPQFCAGCVLKMCFFVLFFLLVSPLKASPEL